MASKNMAFKTESIIYTLLVLGLLIAGNYIFTKVFKRLDLTENKVYSISEPTKNLLKDLDDIINIKIFFSRNLPPNLKKVETDVKDLITEFKAYAGGNLNITYSDPMEDEKVKEEVKALRIPEIQMQSIEKDKAQLINGYLGMAILYADKQEIIPVVQDVKNLEYDLAQKIMKVSRSATPKIVVLKTDTTPYFDENMRRQMRGQLPPDPTEEKYKPIFNALKENYEVITLDISKGEPIDQSIKTLIVPGGDAQSYTDADLLILDQYFMKGGNLIVLSDAINVTMERGVNAAANPSGMIAMLRHHGIEVAPQLVLDASCGQVQVPQQVGPFMMNVPKNYPFFPMITPDGFNKENPAVSGLAQMAFPWISPVYFLTETSDSAASEDKLERKNEILISSSKNSWSEEGRFDLNPSRDWQATVNQKQADFTSYALATYSSGEFKSYFHKLKELEPDKDIVAEGKELNLVVVGDSDFLSAQHGAPGNVAWLLNVVDWLTLDENLISIRSRSLVDRSLTSDRLAEGNSYANLIRIINLTIMPVLLIAFGLFIFMRRREDAK